MVALKYRTTDNAQWGAGLARDLEPQEIDQNFYDLETRLDAVEQNPALPNEIESFRVEGNKLYVTMADHTEFGPYTLPQAAFSFTGAFQPNHDYQLYDFLTANNGLYMVLHPFTSGDAFVFGSDAEGPFYQYVMPYPTFYEIGFFFPGQPGYGILSSEAMFTLRTSARTPYYLPAVLAGSSAGLLVAPNNDLSFPIFRDAVQIGSIDFAHGETQATFAFPAAVQFTDPSALRVLRPDALDDAAYDLSVSFAGVKGTL
jgi:hypothetical protein